MHHGANVGFVYAHAEGVGGHDDRRFPSHEGFLGGGAFSWCQPGVVGAGIDTYRLKGGCGSLHVLPGRCVDDGALVSHPISGRPGLVLGPGARQDLQGEVLPVESQNEPGSIRQVQLLHHVVLHRRSGRGGQRDRGNGTQGTADLSQAKVIRPEVMPPGREAVGLVHRQQANVAPGEALDESRLEALRGHVHKLPLARIEACEPGVAFLGGEG